MSGFERHFGALAFGVAICCAAASAGQDQHAPQKPNIVFLLVDDLGWADLGCYGADLHETPRIDQLAKEGMRFTEAYAAAPVCTPTRASILTGKAPARLHMTIWRESATNRVKNRRLLPPDAQPNLPHEELTLAERLQEAEYACAHIGKWHLGGFEQYPQTMGFDVAIGGTGWGAPHTFWWPYRGRGRFGDEYRYVPHLDWGEPGEYLTDRLTTEAIHVMERLRDRPFFLYLCWHTVHTPIEGKPSLVDRYQQRADPDYHHQNAEYAAMVASLDENVGRILDRLDEWGIADNTLVILTSDNGGYVNNYRGTQVTSNRPLRSGKGSLYEGGIRVPLIIRWPKHVAAGSVTRQPVTSTDFYPTIMELLGLNDERVAKQATDGVSFTGLLSDPNTSLERPFLAWHYPHYYPTTSPVSAIRAGNWKLIKYYEDGRQELYDLSRDLGEQKDLASELPERTRSLQNMLDQWLAETGAQFPKANPGAPKGNAVRR